MFEGLYFMVELSRPLSVEKTPSLAFIYYFFGFKRVLSDMHTYCFECLNPHCSLSSVSSVAIFEGPFLIFPEVVSLHRHDSSFKKLYCHMVTTKALLDKPFICSMLVAGT